jgi:hypothetical protein
VLVNPTEIAAGWEGACIIDAGNLKCWGAGLPHQLPMLQNPRRLTSGFGGTGYCAIDDSGILCWGYPQNPEVFSAIPAFTNPNLLSMGSDFACGADASGIKCWGNNDQGQLNVPALTSPTTQVSENSFYYGRALKEISDVSPPAHEKFLKELFAFSESKLEKNRLYSPSVVLWKIVEPMVVDGSSKVFVDLVIPQYIDSWELLRAENLAEIKPKKFGPLETELLLVTLKSALSVANDFYTVEERKKLASLFNLIAIATVHGANKTSVQAVIDRVNKQKKLLQELGDSEKSAFLLATIELAKGFLEEAIK